MYRKPMSVQNKKVSPRTFKALCLGVRAVLLTSVALVELVHHSHSDQHIQLVEHHDHDHGHDHHSEAVLSDIKLPLRTFVGEYTVKDPF